MENKKRNNKIKNFKRHDERIVSLTELTDAYAKEVIVQTHEKAELVKQLIEKAYETLKSQKIEFGEFEEGPDFYEFLCEKRTEDLIDSSTMSSDEYSLFSARGSNGEEYNIYVTIYIEEESSRRIYNANMTISKYFQGIEAFRTVDGRWMPEINEYEFSKEMYDEIYNMTPKGRLAYAIWDIVNTSNFEDFMQQMYKYQQENGDNSDLNGLIDSILSNKDTHNTDNQEFECDNNLKFKLIDMNNKNDDPEENGIPEIMSKLNAAPSSEELERLIKKNEGIVKLMEAVGDKTDYDFYYNEETETVALIPAYALGTFIKYHDGKYMLFQHALDEEGKDIFEPVEIAETDSVEKASNFIKKWYNAPKDDENCVIPLSWETAFCFATDSLWKREIRRLLHSGRYTEEEAKALRNFKEKMREEIY